MPMFPEGQDPLDQTQGPAQRASLGASSPDPFQPPPTVNEAIPAAFRQNNPIFSVLDAVTAQSPSHAYDPNYNPLDTLKGTRFAQDPTPFLDDPNEATTRARMAKSDDEMNDQRTLAGAGWAGTIASIGAGLTDPSYYIPLFGELHAAEAGGSFVRSALRTAASGAGQSAISEVAAHATQENRTWKESAGNIATNTLMMGVLGGALGTLSKGEQAVANDGLEAARRDATPVNALDPKSMSLQDHITPGESGFSQGVEQRATELHAAGAAASPIEAVEAAHIEGLPEDIAREAYGPTAQDGIGTAAERGGVRDLPDPSDALGEPGGGFGDAGGYSGGEGDIGGDRPTVGPAAADGASDTVGDATLPMQTRRSMDPPPVDGVRGYASEVSDRGYVFRPASIAAETDGRPTGIKYHMADGAASIETSLLPDDVLGQGKGFRMYRAFAKAMKAQGVDIHSDTTLSDPAVRMYQKLSDAGYSVRKDPTAKTIDGATFTTNGQPVYRVINQTPNGGKIGSIMGSKAMKSGAEWASREHVARVEEEEFERRMAAEMAAMSPEQRTAVMRAMEDEPRDRISGRSGAGFLSEPMMAFSGEGTRGRLRSMGTTEAIARRTGVSAEELRARDAASMSPEELARRDLIEARRAEGRRSMQEAMNSPAEPVHDRDTSETLDRMAAGDFEGNPAKPGADQSMIERVLADAQGQGRNKLIDMVAADAGVGGSDRSSGMGAAAGADVSDARDLTMKGYGLNQVAGVRKLANALSPNLRVFSGASTMAKRAMADLAETAIRFTQHDRGIPTASAGGALETMVRQDQAKYTATTHHILEGAWADHRYGANKPGLAQRAQDAIGDARGNTPDGKLSYKDFKSAVYDAMYSGDQHPVPQVQQAAKDLRSQIYDPIAKMAQETLGPDGRPMLGDALSPPGGDASFAPRSWNKEAVTAKRYDLKQRITDWLDREQSTKAATKERLADLQERHQALADQDAKLERRLATLDDRSSDTASRLDERAMEAGASQRRADAVGDRASIIKESLSELDEFISSMRSEATDPAQREQLEQLQTEAAALRKEAAPMSAAELKSIERGEIKSVLPGDMRKAAEVYLGKRKLQEPPSFVSSLIKDGGINDTGGDVRSMIGGTRARPGLLNPRGRSLDQIGEALGEQFPHIFPERPGVGDVSDLIENSLRGKEPSWWTEHMEPPDSSAGRVREMSGVFEDFFRESGHEPKNLRDIAEALKDDRGESPAILDRLQQKAEAGRDYEGAADEVDRRKGALAELRSHIEQGRQDRAALQARGRVADARQGEAEVGANRNKGRLGLLQERMDRQQTMRDLLESARQNAETERTNLRAKMEKELRDWKGSASADAMAALKSRDEAERVRGLKQEAGTYNGDGARLTSADGPVDRGVKRILNSDRDLSRGELSDRADEIIDRIIGSPDGRIGYDMASGGPNIGGVGGPAQELRGSLKARDFAIPTDAVKDFVNRDMEHVTSSFLRTMLPDIQLTRRFGDVDMTQTFRKIQEEYARKIGPDTTEAEAKAINAQRNSDIRDVAAVRDRLRGVYGWNPGSRVLPDLIRDFRNATSLASLGTSVANRFNDTGAQAVFRYGIQNVFQDAWRPFFKSMLGMSPLVGVAKRQAAEMGIGIEGLIGHNRHNLSDINESYAPGNKFSRAMSYLNDRSMLVNMHGPWTDLMKNMSWVPAQAEFGRIADRIAAGGATKRDLQVMADANIDPHMATRISQQIGQHSIHVDGVRLATASKWTDLGARDAFERALAREVNINVITAGIGDKPLFLSTPLGGMIGQFKGFVAGAHERILISNLQQRDGRTMQGMLTSVAMGMVSYRLYTLLSGQDASPRPQDWIKEGIHRSAITGWLSEANNTLAKFTGGKTDLNNLYGADRPLTRRQGNSPLSELLGPTYARLEGLSGAAMHAVSGNAKAADLHQARMALPLQNLMGVRRLIDSAEDGVATNLGMKPRNHSPQEWPQ